MKEKIELRASMTNELNLTQLSTICAERLKKVYNHYLNNIPSLELKQAMEYTLLNQGKLLRPLIVFATGSIFNTPLDHLDVAASAVEVIHTYSLIHDDLPCMDNATSRRGQPTCHLAYGETIAILAGDALHTLAMQILASHPAAISLNNRLQMIYLFSKAGGPYGMAAGQALDMTALTKADSLSIDLLETIYRLKTGTLISACVEAGRLCANSDDIIHQKALQTFGESIGLAFQIQDDILDSENSAQTGKDHGLDIQNHKITYPMLCGLQKAKNKVQSLYENALESINYLGSKAQLLRQLTEEMLNRNR